MLPNQGSMSYVQGLGCDLRESAGSGHVRREVPLLSSTENVVLRDQRERRLSRKRKARKLAKLETVIAMTIKFHRPSLAGDAIWRYELVRTLGALLKTWEHVEIQVHRCALPPAQFQEVSVLARAIRTLIRLTSRDIGASLAAHADVLQQVRELRRSMDKARWVVHKARGL